MQGIHIRVHGRNLLGRKVTGQVGMDGVWLVVWAGWVGWVWPWGGQEERQEG